MNKSFILFLALIIYPLAAFAMPADDRRQGTIDRTMTLVEASLERAPYAEVAVEPETQAVVMPIEIAPRQEEAPVVTDRPVWERRHNNELAFSMGTYLFETGDKWPLRYSLLYAESDKVEKNGAMFGIYGAKTWRISEPLRHAGDIWRISPLPNVVRFEAEFLMGKVDYSSYATGKREGFDVQDIDARLLFGYDYVWSDTTMITPYIGVGWRRVSDTTGGWVDFIARAYEPFKTETSFLYIPVGIETLTQVSKQWDIHFKFEGSLVAGGATTIFLNDIPGLYTIHDVDANQDVQGVFQKSTSDLKGGFGLRTSCKLIRKYSAFDLFLEPYFKAWHLKKSEAMQAHFRGNNNKDYVSVYDDGSTYKPVWMPQNVTASFGLRMGMQF
ncbi:MAG: hypothetical protein WCO69_01460 [Candidatus Omnitrophota bacterium]